MTIEWAETKIMTRIWILKYRNHKLKINLNLRNSIILTNELKRIILALKDTVSSLSWYQNSEMESVKNNWKSKGGLTEDASRLSTTKKEKQIQRVKLSHQIKRQKDYQNSHTRSTWLQITIIQFLIQMWCDYSATMNWSKSRAWEDFKMRISSLRKKSKVHR
mgnify:CR=1 FL=1